MMIVQDNGSYNVEKAIDEILLKYSAKQTALIMVLQDIQKHFNFLPIEAIRMVAHKMVLPLAQIYSVATFYKAFSLTPRGKHHICVCTGTACHVKQATVIVDNISRELKIEPRETTKDGLISYETVNCLGACALGPLVTVNEEYYGNMNVAKMNKLLDDLKGVKSKASLTEEAEE